MNLTAVIKPIRYVTAKIGTGGGAGRGDHEVVTAEIAPDENVLPHYIDTLVGKYYKSYELPITFTTTGTALTDWKIYGNEDGLGDYTGADLYSGTLEQGRIYDDSGALDSSDTRIRTDGYFATLQAGTYRFDATKSSTADSAALRACLYAYDNNGNYIGYFPSDWSEFPFQVSLPAANYKMMISYTDNGTITPAHVSAVSCIPAGMDVPTITNGYSIPVTVRGKNLLENNCSSETYNGLTVTVNADKSITLSGTAERSGGIAIFDGSFYQGGLPSSIYQEFSNGSYILSGSPEGSAVGKYILSYRYTSAIGEVISQADRVPAQGVTLDNTGGAYKYLAVYIAVWKDTVLSGVTFKPMLRKSGTEGTYEAYFHNTVTLTVNHPLDAGESISRTSTGVNIPTSDTLTNVLSVDTAVQPDEVYLNFQT